MRDWSSC